MASQTFVEQISKTGFLVSVSSYAIFWLMDTARPGFVARYFSVHIFLFSAIVFGIVWARKAQVSKDHRIIQYVFASLFGITACMITWRLGWVFSDERILLAVFALFVPFLALFLLRSK